MLILRSKMMKALILLGLLVGLCYGSVNAQKTVRLNSTPKAFKTFFMNFRTAVAKRNKQAVASFSRFPFEWGFDAGDEGTWTKSQFLKNYGRIFDGSEAFLAAKNPSFYVEGGTYNLTNEGDASHCIFSKQGSSYRLTAYVVEP